jgi:hypothetical protein
MFILYSVYSYIILCFSHHLLKKSLKKRSPFSTFVALGLTCGLLRTWAAYERLGLAPQHMISNEPLPVARLKRPSAAQAPRGFQRGSQRGHRMAMFAMAQLGKHHF